MPITIQKWLFYAFRSSYGMFKISWTSLFCLYIIEERKIFSRENFLYRGKRQKLLFSDISDRMIHHFLDQRSGHVLHNFFLTPMKLKKRDFSLQTIFREFSKWSGNPIFLVFRNLYWSIILDSKIDEFEREIQF